jgi:hypothetical protein
LAWRLAGIPLTEYDMVPDFNRDTTARISRTNTAKPVPPSRTAVVMQPRKHRLGQLDPTIRKPVVCFPAWDTVLQPSHDGFDVTEDGQSMVYSDGTVEYDVVALDRADALRGNFSPSIAVRSPGSPSTTR